MPQIITDPDAIGAILHEWEVNEYEQHDRPRRWYVVMGLMGAALVVYALVTQNFLFALIIVLFAMVLFLQSHQTAPKVVVRVTDRGVGIQHRFYEWSELDNFFIIYRPPEVQTLFIDTKTSLRPRLRLPLLDNDPNDLRFTLRQYLPEDTETEDEPLSDRVARMWGIL